MFTKRNKASLATAATFACAISLMCLPALAAEHSQAVNQPSTNQLSTNPAEEGSNTSVADTQPLMRRLYKITQPKISFLKLAPTLLQLI